LPIFAWRAVRRLAPEIVRALPTWPRRCGFAASYAARTLIYPASPTRMAAWAREWMALDLTGECQRIRVPTLIITGEADLDRVVPVSSSLEYLDLIAGARHAAIRSTGHLGFVLEPEMFAGMISHFVQDGGRRPGDGWQSDRHART
jgi:pimeloyl-ACP methyl ester carboxylesterase